MQSAIDLPRQYAKALLGLSSGIGNIMGEAENEGLITNLRRLYGHLSSRRSWQLAALLCLMLVGAVAELATLGAVLPFLTLMADPSRAASYPALQGLSDAFNWQYPSDLLLPATILFATIAIAAGAVRLLLVWVMQKFIYRLGHDLAKDIYRRTLYQPYGYHVSKNTSELIGAITKVQSVTGAVLLPLMFMFSGAVISAFILAALFLINWLVATVAIVGFGFLYLAVGLLTKTRLRSNSVTIARSINTRVKVAQEGLGGIRDVLLDRAQPVFVRAYERADIAFADAQTLNTFFAFAPRFVVEAAGMVLIAIMALSLAQGPDGLAIALPTLGAMALGAQRLLPLVQQIYQGWNQVSGNCGTLVDVLTYLDLQVDEARTCRIVPMPFRRDIVFDKICFCYGPNQPLVVKGLDLRICKGERVAIVGKTGSGKSTIMDLTMGLLDPSVGTIRIDGVALSPENIGSWQANIAHVPQAIYLSDASIAQNIAFAIPPHEIDMDRVREAARQAQIAAFIEGLANGYDTEVGERGVRLSGGQRQRIGLARALYRRASVLVLDEATSALDNETENAVMEAIGGLDRDLTILLVAHRLTTVALCDRVFKISEGRAHECSQPQSEAMMAGACN